MDDFGTRKAAQQGSVLMATNREIDYTRRAITVEAAVQKVVDRAASVREMRQSSVPDDSGVGGFSEDDEDGHLTHTRWFTVGDAVGSAPLRPW